MDFVDFRSVSGSGGHPFIDERFRNSAGFSMFCRGSTERKSIMARANRREDLADGVVRLLG